MTRTRFDARARAVGLTRAQWRMIATIAVSEGATQSEVASQLEINTVTAGRIIDRLEASGVVERRASPADRRANHLYITPRAAPILKTLGAIGEEEERISLQNFSEEERAMLSNLLQRLVDNMVQAPPAGTPSLDDDDIDVPSPLVVSR
ncbi:MarR family winged helix-turn-helix transcriptional regulator [Sphingomonas bacterium]|uniref:MarR family winged helix-turn-helix transcriptional regulator n=1 Tax=Sphingomonas bacterium TaxID=1895847 RepID=UPI0015774DD4|nr:MarR family transcriptional regulator [Sphingomonas bacterium]